MGDAVAVFSPCGRFRVSLHWTAGGVCKLSACAKDTDTAYVALIDDGSAFEATSRSGCGSRTAAELAEMLHAALVGRSEALEYTVMRADEALGTPADVLVFKLLYRAEFTNAVIVLRLTPHQQSNERSVTQAASGECHNPACVELRHEIAELRSALTECDAKVRRVEAEKAKVTDYAKHTLAVLREETTALKRKLGDAEDRRGAERLKQALSATKRDAENARAELSRAHRELERLRAELRRSSQRARTPTPVRHARDSAPLRSPSRSRSPAGSDASSVGSRSSRVSRGSALTDRLSRPTVASAAHASSRTARQGSAPRSNRFESPPPGSQRSSRDQTPRTLPRDARPSHRPNRFDSPVPTEERRARSGHRNEDKHQRVARSAVHSERHNRFDSPASRERTRRW